MSLFCLYFVLDLGYASNSRDAGPKPAALLLQQAVAAVEAAVGARLTAVDAVDTTQDAVLQRLLLADDGIQADLKVLEKLVLPESCELLFLPFLPLVAPPFPSPPVAVVHARNAAPASLKTCVNVIAVYFPALVRRRRSHISSTSTHPAY